MSKRTRVTTIAVARCLSHTRQECDSRLSKLWNESTSLANWAVVELIKDSPVPVPGVETAKFNDTYLYGLLDKYEGKVNWAGAMANANAILRAVRHRWIKDRMAVMVQRRQAPPLFKYPYPYRVHNKQWLLSMTASGPIISVAMPGGRMEFLLRSGSQYRRQIAALRRMLDGAAKKGEMMLSRHRKTKQVMAMMVGTFEDDVGEQDNTGVLTVRTEEGRFWVAETASGREWILNADHMPRLVDNHRRFLDRVSEDTKFEKRWPRRMRRHINEAVRDRCLKNRNRIDSFIREACDQLVGWAVRQKCGTIEYDDYVRTFFSDGKFDWSGLTERLRSKCADLQIDFHCVASGDSVKSENIEESSEVQVGNDIITPNENVTAREEDI